MQRCILHGHEPKLFDGHGENAGKTYWVCVHCNKTEKAATGRECSFAPDGDRRRAFVDPANDNRHAP